MSRNRRYRSEVYDDYYDDIEDDDYYEEEEAAPSNEASQYLWRGDNAAAQLAEPEPEPAPVRDDDLMGDLIQQFRGVLGDNTISAEEIDAAIVATDYDVDAAMALLSERVAAQHLSSNLEMKLPQSAIGKLIASEEDDSPPKLPQHLTSEMSVDFDLSTAYDRYVNPEAAVALFQSDMRREAPKPFNFDTPSPDDVILAKQAKATSRAKIVGRLPGYSGRVSQAGTSSSDASRRPRNAPPVVSDNTAALSMGQRASADKKNSKAVETSTNAVAEDDMSRPSRTSQRAISKAANHRIQNMLHSGPNVGRENKRGRNGSNTMNGEFAENGETSKSRTNTPSSRSTVVKQREKDIKLPISEGCDSMSVSVVVAGHVDAGKSTLLGHLLQIASAGHSEGNSRRVHKRPPEELAWGTDEDSVERERGITIDIATRVFTTAGHNPRTYAMIDAPGHRDFVPAMILGATQASAALLVVDASQGEFEAGFSENGQTREHALLLKSLGINRLIVVINKMDVVDYSEERFQEVKAALTKYLRGNGWKVARGVSFVAASGRDGINLLANPEPTHPLMKWYDGESLLETMEKLPSTEKSIIREISEKPTRLVVSDFFRSTTLGGSGAVTGRLLCGSVAPKDKLVICPGGAIVTVKNVMVGEGSKSPVAVAGVDSLPVSIGFTDIKGGILVSPGFVLCDPEAPVPVVDKFQAQILTTSTGGPLIQGSRVELHVGGGTEVASISRLLELVACSKNSKRSRNEKQRRPRRLTRGDTALVEITCDRSMSVEKAADVKSLGRITLRQNGRTVAVGVVVDV